MIDPNKQHKELPSHLDQIKGVPPLEMPDGYGRGNLSEYEITETLEDTALIQYIDGDSKEKVVGGIIMQANVSTKMWRAAEVLMVGPDCKMLKVGDNIIFPTNNPNITGVKNLKVNGKAYRELYFIKENIVFCKCNPVTK